MTDTQKVIWEKIKEKRKAELIAKGMDEETAEVMSDFWADMTCNQVKVR